MDSDDEVRDRATFYMNILQQKQKALNAAYIFNGKKIKTHTHKVCADLRMWVCAWVMIVCLLLLSGLSVSIPGLEKSLHQYTLEPSEKPFDMKSVPLATTPITEQKTGRKTNQKYW